ncbi:MAG: hypothetical protein GFH27_549409n12 [Chloroflexi bacterium AL-W]|nr:hypothetical protein [Chloroflexi bacterium AL-N1]NOK71347.1 hypothetical protein [Chloroflexi bacterium AL-N10]NOK78750.1 hypothetical protein [Chloroflexi bacterium AL-N5]NOK86120.1 hypothetical protein [Chloroflexi bacterium AL-W]NOK93073.1 hypothetical protein [Chloroflexi bacterium AL-N15]
MNPTSSAVNVTIREATIEDSSAIASLLRIGFAIREAMLLRSTVVSNDRTRIDDSISDQGTKTQASD